MSTKTTFKRIALVAVAALGLGVLTSVAPASAAAVTPTAITLGTIPAAAVGTVHAMPITIAYPVSTGSDTFTISVRVTAAPTGSGYKNFQTTLATGVTTTGTNVKAAITVTKATSNDGIATTAAADTSTSSVDGATVGTLYTSSNTTGAAGKASFLVNVTPDFAGTYSVLVSTNNAAISVAAATLPIYTSGDAVKTYSFTTGISPTSVTLSAVTGADTTGSGTGTGRLMKATLNTGAVLATSETITLTTNQTTSLMGVINQTNGTTGGGLATLVLGASNFVAGAAYFKLADSAAAATTTVITATGSGLLSSSVTSTISSTTVLLAAAASITVNNGLSAYDGTGVAVTRPGSGHVGGSSGATFTDTASTTATSHTYGLATATLTAGVTRMAVTDTSGDITGIVGVVYYTYVSTPVTNGVGSVSFTATLAAGESFTATISSSTASASITVTGATAAAATNTIAPATTIRQLHGATTLLSAVLKDQFGAVMVNQAVTVATTGRNVLASAANGVTDATGSTTYSRTDAGTAATVSTADVVTITSGGIAASAVTINYAATSAASSIACLTGNESDTANSVTYRDIDAFSLAGVSTGAASLCTVTIKDVNGSILTGIPVTVTTASAGAAVKSTSATLYTGSVGTVAPSVYGWTAGTKTFTITAGTVTKTVTVNYRQGGATGSDNPTEVRTIASVVSGNSIIISAKDRFGNPVSGVPLFASRTGNGLFGGGSNTNGQTTDVNGSAEFIFNAGSTASVVTITAGSLTSAIVAYGQTSSAAGALCIGVDCTSAAFTAATVGTSTTAETGVGASLSPAGVGVVTASVAATVADTSAADNASAATDAASEATDAANAATDAANAAAEAADAATAAAQDASDAVAALSVQVASLIADLKAQISAQAAAITALTNLIIKIQKKVKA